MSASDLKSECVRQSCRQLLFYGVGLFTGQAAAVPFCEALGSVCGCVYGWQLTQSLCASKSKGQFISFNVTNTHWHTGTHTYLSLFLSVSVYVWLCVIACVWRDLGAWELCGNHIGLPLAHLRVMGNNTDQKQQELCRLQPDHPALHCLD